MAPLEQAGFKATYHKIDLDASIVLVDHWVQVGRIGARGRAIARAASGLPASGRALDIRGEVRYKYLGMPKYAVRLA